MQRRSSHMRLGARLVALLLAATAAWASAAQVRLLNAIPGGWSALSQGGQLLANATAAGATSAYVPFNCSLPLQLSHAGAGTSEVSPPGCAAPHWLAVARRSGDELVAHLQAASVAVQSTDYIDTARLRVWNAAGVNVTVRAWSAECYRCLLPPLAALPAGGAMTDYVPLSTKYAYVVEVESATAAAAPQSVIADRTETWTLASEHSQPLGANAGCGGGAELACQTLWLQANATTAAYTVARYEFRQHGVYDVVVLPGVGVDTPATLAVSLGAVGSDTVQLYEPLWVASVVFVGAIIVYQGAKGVIARLTATEQEDDTLGNESVHVSDAAARSGKPNSKQRVKSIDTFRGMALAIMVGVNYGGAGDAAGFGGYWFFDHSVWDGLTVADLVFPWFLWTMGVSMGLSLAGQRRRGASKCAMTQKLLLRAVKLFVLGVAIIDNAADLSNARIPGVLQYFAAATVLVGLSEVWLPRCAGCSDTTAAAAPAAPPAPASGSVNPPTFAPGFAGAVGPSTTQPLLPSTASRVQREGPAPVCSASGLGAAACGEAAVAAPQFALFAVVLGTYLSLQFLLPVPGCPTGYIGPGGLGDFGRHPTCTGGAHGYIDRQLWGVRHMFHSTTADNTPVSGATCADVYQCAVYDPEGTLGALTASLMAFLGLHAGRMLIATKAAIAARRAEGAANGDASEKLAYHAPLLLRWSIWGLGTGLLGAGLAGFAKHGGVLPLSKNLWSPSFVFALSGMAFLAVAALYLLVDVWHVWTGSPFTYIGSNSVVVYVGSEVLQYYFPFTITTHPPVGGYAGPIFRSHTGAVVANTIGVGSWMLIAYAMYQAKFFVTL